MGENRTLLTNSSLGGSGNLTKTGDGILFLTNPSATPNTFSGELTIEAGTLRTTGTLATTTGNPDIVLKGGTRVENGGAAASTVTLTGGTSRTHLDGNITLVGTTGGTSTGTSLVFGRSGGGAINLRTNVEINVENALNDNGGGFVQIQGVSEETAGLSLTKVGQGTLRLTAGTTHTGGTFINQGTIQIPAGIGSINGNVTINGGRLLNDVNAVDMGGGSVLTLVSGSYEGSDRSSIRAGSYVFESGDTTDSRLVGTASSLTKNTSGTVTLRASNTFTGAVTLNAGVLELRGASFVENIQVVTTTASSTVMTVADSSVLSVGQYVIGAGSFGFGNNNYIVSIDSPTSVTLAGAIFSNRGGTGTATFQAGSSLGVGGAINLNGGTLRYSATDQVDYSNRFSTAAGQIYSIDTAGQAVTFGSVLSSSGGSLTKLGAGSLTLAADNTYTGSTTVTGGLLVVNGSTAAGSAVTVGADSTLGGSGTVSGNLTLANGAFLAFDVANTLTLGGTLSLHNSFGVGSLRSIHGQAIDWTTIADNSLGYTLLNTSFEFDATNISNFGYGNRFDIGNGRSAYFQNGSLVLVVIPEPSTYALMLCGLLGLLIVVRHRKRVA